MAWPESWSVTPFRTTPDRIQSRRDGVKRHCDLSCHTGTALCPGDWGGHQRVGASRDDDRQPNPAHGWCPVVASASSWSLDAPLNEVEDVRHQRGQVKMGYKPDYGLRLLAEGISRDVDIFFPEFPLSSVTVLNRGWYSTMVEVPRGGEWLALSLDFNQAQLQQILTGAPTQIAEHIRAELSRGQDSPREIELPDRIAFGVRARLGQLQHGQHEEFVPLVVQEILVEDPEVLYETGRSLPHDLGQAAELFRRAAEQGHAGAQDSLGWMYFTGQGVTQDDARALAWTREAAEQGVAGAQDRLALMYADGRGVPQDHRQAAVWFRKAAEQGHAAAQGCLGLMYAVGMGVPEDQVEAHTLLTLAAARTTGEDRRRYAGERDKLAAKMTHSQVTESQKRAAAWAAAFERSQKG